ncbi:MAG: hypothetical protein CVV64_12305 [Candidatus Wallbacteria bacterium HGW-Wallbacteria-1]|jgi:tetratricopeptide (TPR) repeat protein|uniref:Tetratricopeptide repeat protein n=1 Tax=Candidatus Wallbacteria bacterium HGW-Wallbacteria-1 TaxID=2013854 RepID=A0A2N1PN75_9BACT|nr:MAG: hypothetical protein CVV64_12305 [Candidatus Wallbacteria bacterium HGW-Wallbacteria-1]
MRNAIVSVKADVEASVKVFMIAVVMVVSLLFPGAGGYVSGAMASSNPSDEMGGLISDIGRSRANPGIICPACRQVDREAYELCPLCLAEFSKLASGERTEVEYINFTDKNQDKALKQLTRYSRLMERSLEIRKALLSGKTSDNAKADGQKLLELLKIYGELDWYSREIELLDEIEVSHVELFDSNLKTLRTERIFHWGRVLATRGSHEEALVKYQTAAMQGMRGDELSFWMARSLIETGDYDRAIGLLAQVKGPLASSAAYMSKKAKGYQKWGMESFDHYEKGYLLYEAGNFVQSAESFGKALEKRPDFSDAASWKSRALAKQNRIRTVPESKPKQKQKTGARVRLKSKTASKLQSGQDASLKIRAAKKPVKVEGTNNTGRAEANVKAKSKAVAPVVHDQKTAIDDDDGGLFSGY